MTLPRVVRLRLMAVPSLSLSASDPDDRWRSLPARSTRLMLDCLVMFSLEKIWQAFQQQTIITTQDIRYLLSFIYMGSAGTAQSPTFVKLVNPGSLWEKTRLLFMWRLASSWSCSLLWCAGETREKCGGSRWTSPGHQPLYSLQGPVAHGRLSQRSAMTSVGL